MSQKEGQQQNNEAFLSSSGKAQSARLFSIPGDYFLHFPQQMQEIIRVLDAPEPSLSFPQNNPFSLSENYFDEFLPELLRTIKGEEASLHFIGNLPRNNPFRLPANYFAQFEEALLEQIVQQEAVRINEEETKELSPLLSALKDKSTFEVPEGYFEHGRKSIPFKNPAVRSIQWARWTAAAAIILIFGIGGFRFLNPGDGQNPKVSFEQALAQIPDAEIQDYLDKTVNDFELASLTQSYAVNEPPAEENNILKDVTNKEIRAYLEGKGS